MPYIRFDAWWARASNASGSPCAARSTRSRCCTRHPRRGRPRWATSSMSGEPARFFNLARGVPGRRSRGGSQRHDLALGVPARKVEGDQGAQARLAMLEGRALEPEAAIPLDDARVAPAVAAERRDAHGVLDPLDQVFVLQHENGSLP